MIDQKKWNAYVKSELSRDAEEKDEQQTVQSVPELDPEASIINDVKSKAEPAATREIEEMVRDTRRAIANGDLVNARKMVAKIESTLQDVSDATTRKRLSYDLLELKTDIKLASL
jgi:hypothetical protein